MAALSRRRFLRGDFSSDADALRPPWAVPEGEFVHACSRCDACVRACPTAVLGRGSGGYPVVDFTRGECTFCGACAEACRDGALLRGPDAPPWSLRAGIGAACLASQRVVCRTCGDMCEAGAIRFRPQAGGVALPQLDVAACSGCGACVAACPTQAISMRVPEPALAA